MDYFLFCWSNQLYARTEHTKEHVALLRCVSHPLGTKRECDTNSRRALANTAMRIVNNLFKKLE